MQGGEWGESAPKGEREREKRTKKTDFSPLSQRKEVKGGGESYGVKQNLSHRDEKKKNAQHYKKGLLDLEGESDALPTRHQMKRGGGEKI